MTPDGVGGVQLEMTRQDARHALEKWGECQTFRRGQAANEGWSVTRESMTIFAYVDDGDRVERDRDLESRSRDRGR